MNKRTPYEEIIAEKAAQQPIPDLADGIWAAVSAGLDQLPPHVEASNNTPAIRPVSSISVGRLWVYLLGAAALIAIAITWWSLQHQHPLPSKTQPPPVMPATPSKKTILNNDSAHQELNSPGTNHPLEDTRTVIDSAARVDRSIQHHSAPLDFQVRPPHNPSIIIADTSSHAAPKMKKPRGIKDIGGDDYKIVPEKKGSKPR